MKAKKMKATRRTPLAEARYQLKLAQDVAGNMADRLEESQRDLRTAQYDLGKCENTAERHALRVARLEGYIERVHEIERNVPTMLDEPDSLALLREQVANGPEKQARAILDALDSCPDLMDDITGKP